LIIPAIEPMNHQASNSLILTGATVSTRLSVREACVPGWHQMSPTCSQLSAHQLPSGCGPGLDIRTAGSRWRSRSCGRAPALWTGCWNGGTSGEGSGLGGGNQLLSVSTRRMKGCLERRITRLCGKLGRRHSNVDHWPDTPDSLEVSGECDVLGAGRAAAVIYITASTGTDDLPGQGLSDVCRRRPRLFIVDAE
jgi:hypothetical protein